MSEGQTIDHFLDQLASEAPTPGGGSVAGLVAALAAALGSMVRTKTRDLAGGDVERQLSAAATSLRDVRTEARVLGEQDEAAYGAYVAATRLPKSTPEEKATRRRAVQEGLRTAAEVPLLLAEICIDLLTALIPVARYGNRHLLSDAQIAAMLAGVAHRAALVNVRVNLALLKDRALAERIESDAQASERRASDLGAELERVLASR